MAFQRKTHQNPHEKCLSLSFMGKSKEKYSSNFKIRSNISQNFTLHTFLSFFQYLETTSEYKCPYCDTLIHETNPWDMLREDKKLEYMIFKLVPGWWSCCYLFKPRVCHVRIRHSVVNGLLSEDEREDKSFEEMINNNI